MTTQTNDKQSSLLPKYLSCSTPDAELKILYGKFMALLDHQLETVTPFHEASTALQPLAEQIQARIQVLASCNLS
jgi:hypothetical protein